MKNHYKLILTLILLISLTSCHSQKKSDKNSNIENAYRQILKDSILVTGWYYITETDNGFKRQLDKSENEYFISPKPIVTKDNFKKIEIYETDFKEKADNYCGLTIKLDKIGTENWSIATEKAISKRLALIIDDKLINAPIVNSQITVGITAINRSEYNKNEILEFMRLIDK